MADEKKMIIGIDLSKKYIQACYMLNDMTEPESVILGFASKSYQIPSDGYKKKGENKWTFGDSGKQYYDDGDYIKVDDIIDKVIKSEPIELDEEKYMPMDILECLLRFVLKECVRATDTEKVSKLAVCVDRFQKKYLDMLKTVLKRMDFKEEDILLLSRTDCFVYYTLNAPEELYKRGVSMFDFDGSRVVYSYMNYANLENKTVVMVDSKRDRVNSREPAAVDSELAKLAAGYMDMCAPASVYLTGEGFEKYDQLDGFLKTAVGRRRAFIGPNLYAKGAAIGAFEVFYGGNYKNRIMATDDRILADFDIDILEREQEKVYRAVRVGTNWYGASKKLRFLVSGNASLDIHIKPIEKKPDQDISFSLEDFPKRPDRMTKLIVEIEFSSASECRIAVRDAGFGDFYKSSDKVICKDIHL